MNAIRRNRRISTVAGVLILDADYEVEVASGDSIAYEALCVARLQEQVDRDPLPVYVR